jgi:hypothetical protein
VRLDHLLSKEQLLLTLKRTDLRQAHCLALKVVNGPLWGPFSFCPFLSHPQKNKDWLLVARVVLEQLGFRIPSSAVVTAHLERGWPLRRGGRWKSGPTASVPLSSRTIVLVQSRCQCW